MAVMTSRERVLQAVNFQDSDRVPIDLGAMKASGSVAPTGESIGCIPFRPLAIPCQDRQ